MSARALLAVVLALLAVAGCGFHLEGHTPLPDSLRAPLLEARDRQTDFVQSLRRALLTAGARVTDETDEASAVVHVLDDELDERVLAVSSTNLPREYELTYKVRFSVSVNGTELLAAQDVSATRDFSFDEHYLLAKTNEEQILREALAHDLVGVVMRRLERLPAAKPQT
jgi:LPS-assembly lipoprotein